MQRKKDPRWRRVDPDVIENIRAMEILRTNGEAPSSMKMKVQDAWGPAFGQKGRLQKFDESYTKKGKCSPFDTINQKLLSGKCRVMVLGPADGNDLVALHGGLVESFNGEKVGSDLEIDTFGLTNRLSPEAQAIVHHDYSMPGGDPTPFELWEDTSLIGKYDVVISQLGVGFYTQNPTAALAKAATLLSDGGKAFIQVGPTQKSNMKEVLEKLWDNREPNKQFVLDPIEQGRSRWYIIHRNK
ncbi:MAG: hypothetical protein ABH950_09330 [Candidatus Altiarchaeota archaeon]